MKKALHILPLIFVAAISTAQQYNVIKQEICWTDTSGVDSSLTRFVYVSVAGAGPISILYINAAGQTVDVSAGGDFQIGYCGCCSDVSEIESFVSGDSVFVVSGDTVYSGQNIQAFTPGIIPMTKTDSTLTEDKGRLNWNSFYNRVELGSYPAEGLNDYSGILQWYDLGSDFGETFIGPGEWYNNRWVSGANEWLQGIEFSRSGAGANTYRRNNSVQSQVFSAVPNNYLLSEIRFKNYYTNALSITPFSINHVSTTGTSTTGGRLYFSIQTTSPPSYANVTNASNIYFWIDRATRSFNLNNTYNGDTRDDSGTFTPSRPLYTNAAGEVKQAPVGTFQVEDPTNAGASETLQNTINNLYAEKSSGELNTFFTKTPADTLALTTTYQTYTVWQSSDISGPDISLSTSSDSLLLDIGVWEVHYDIQAIFYDAGANNYIRPAIRQGSGVLTKTIRTAYNVAASTSRPTHLSVTFRTEITADNTPISLVIAGDDGGAGGVEVLLQKAILFAEKIGD